MQRAKSAPPQLISRLGSLTVFKDEQKTHRSESMYVTLSGMTREVRLEHPENTSYPIHFRLLGRETEVRLLQR